MGYFGCHLSASGGNAAMVKTALSIGANTFAFFTRNPRGSKAKDLDPADASALRDLMARPPCWKKITLENWSPTGRIP